MGKYYNLIFYFLEKSLGVKNDRKDTSPWAQVELKFRNNMHSIYE